MFISNNSVDDLKDFVNSDKVFKEQPLRFLAGVLGHGIALSLGTALLCRAPHPDRAIAISVVTQIGFSSVLLLALPKVLSASDIKTVYLTLVAIVLALLPLLKLANDSLTRDSETAALTTVKPLLIWLLVALVCYQLGLSAIWAFIESIGRERQISLEQMGNKAGVGDGVFTWLRTSH